MRLEAFADVAGVSLNVGWHLQKEVATGIMSHTPRVQQKEARRAERDRRGDDGHSNALTGAFHSTVFLPVMQQLVAKVEKDNPVAKQANYFD